MVRNSRSRLFEVAFILSLAIGGVRDIITPYGVFALQMLTLFSLIFVKFYLNQTQKTTSIISVLLPAFMILYFLFRIIFSISISQLNIDSIIIIIKHFSVLMAISICFFRFKLLDDMFYFSKRYNIIHFIIISGFISTIYILFIHLINFRIGRIEDGLYFSTIYVFSTFISIFFFLSGKRVFSYKVDLFILLILIIRLLIDLRRTPILMLAIFVILFFLAGTFKKTIFGNGKSFNPVHAVLRLLLFLIFLYGILLFVQSGIFSRLNLQSLKYALFDVRYIDIIHTIDLTMRVNPIFGVGPLADFDLIYSEQVHSLPVRIFSEYGFLGVSLFVGVWLIITVKALFALLRRDPDSETRSPFLFSASLYALFFTFSARGFEIEVFAILGLAVAVGAKRR